MENKEQNFTVTHEVFPEFGIQKKQVLDWLKAPKQIDSRGEEEPVDKNIINIIRLMNEKLPFLFTTASCGGHFYSREEIRAMYPNANDNQLVLPNEGYIVGGGGYIRIATDGTEKSKSFLSALRQILIKYPDAELIERNSSEYDLNLIRQLDDDDAFTVNEATVAKNQIKALFEDIGGLVVNFPNYATPE